MQFLIDFQLSIDAPSYVGFCIELRSARLTGAEMTKAMHLSRAQPTVVQIFGIYMMVNFRVAILLHLKAFSTFTQLCERDDMSRESFDIVDQAERAALFVPTTISDPRFVVDPIPSHLP